LGENFTIEIKLLGARDVGRLRFAVIKIDNLLADAVAAKNGDLGGVSWRNGESMEKFSLFNLAPADFAATAMKHFEEFTKAQTEQFDSFQETNRQWLDRLQAEANLASEFVSKLTAARSIPDAMTACQECGSRRLEMMVEDTKHLLDNMQKFMRTNAQLLASAWESKGPSVSG